MARSTSIRTPDLELVRQIVLDALRGYRAKAWLFGSQAAGRARIHSDIDVAILPLAPLPPAVFPALREALETQQFNLQRGHSGFVRGGRKISQAVLEEGVPWKE